MNGKVRRDYFKVHYRCCLRHGKVCLGKPGADDAPAVDWVGFRTQ